MNRNKFDTAPSFKKPSLCKITSSWPSESASILLKTFASKDVDLISVFNHLSSSLSKAEIPLYRSDGSSILMDVIKTVGLKFSSGR